MEFNCKTLVVLGAGASKPYGYPVGSELKNKIIHSILGNNGVVFEILKELYPVEELVKFAKAFMNSRISSIDAFLVHQNNRYAEIGKIAIAAVMLESERSLNLFPESADWFSYFFNKYFGPSNVPLEERGVAFITFNYEFTLQRMLRKALESAYNLEFNRSIELLEQIPILHVYGNIGDEPISRNGKFLDRDSIDFRRYRATEASKSIKVMYEDREVIDKKFSGYFYEASTIYFLGCECDKLNMERLGVDWSKVKGGIKCSRYGLREAETIEASTRFEPAKPIFGSNAWDALDLLRER